MGPKGRRVSRLAMAAAARGGSRGDPRSSGLVSKSKRETNEWALCGFTRTQQMSVCGRAAPFASSPAGGHQSRAEGVRTKHTQPRVSLALILDCLRV